MDRCDDPPETKRPVEKTVDPPSDAGDRTLPRESKLLRPKSYPNNSPSPEKVYIARKTKRDETKSAKIKDEPSTENKNDVEVSFSVTLPRKSKTTSVKRNDSLDQKQDLASLSTFKVPESSITLRKYQVISSDVSRKSEEKDTHIGNGSCKTITPEFVSKSEVLDDTKLKVTNHASKLEDVKLKPIETEIPEKKGTIKKKIVKKVSSKSKTDVGSNQDSSEVKSSPEKKKVTKKIKDKSTEDATKPVVKKKSVLQSIGQRLEKLTTKSSSPEKASENMSEKSSITSDTKRDSKRNRMQREQSVPVAADPPTESGLIKRAVTLTDVAALDTATPNKNAVSKVLGLFKKFESKEKLKPIEPEGDDLDRPVEKIPIEIEKPKRPTSLLLNGLGRKSKFTRASSDTTALENDDLSGQDKENSKDDKNVRNSLKLDFSRLPRVKKIVPTNPVIEPQVMNVSSEENDSHKKDIFERNGNIPAGVTLHENRDVLGSRSRSRSRSTFSNSELKSDLSMEYKPERTLLSPSESGVHHPHRNRESTSPDKEDIVDRIRRKSFYSRFNEKKQRRKSSLVGPGATEYDPLARIHAPPTENKYDISPTSPNTYDVSPGFSVKSDVTPSPERYRSLLTDLSTNTRSGLRFDNYGLNDKIDSYRSLDRNEFRKYPGSRSYIDYDQPLSYGAPRYARTKSLLENSDGEDSVLGHSSIPNKYNRTISMYTPGSYATYRPKRTRNSAIILKESEKEPSPENILEKIRQRKSYSISVTRKPDTEKEPLPRSYTAPKGEGDGTERPEKAD